jgi:hypothetical protein
MPARNALKGALSRRREIEITISGRQSGRAISIPVWFVLNDDTVCLLPARGSETQWYKNVLKNPVMRIKAGSTETEFKANTATDPEVVSAVIEKFRAKYGDGGIKLYSKLDVAVFAQKRS